MKVTIALKKQSGDGLFGKVVEKAIKWWTKSEYFHVEMIIKDKWVSSSPEAGAVYIHDLEPLNKNYDYFDVEIDGRKLPHAWAFLELQKDKKYDYWGLFFSTVVKMNLEDKQKWFCSELVSEALSRLGIEIPKPSNQMTPEDVYQLVK